MLVMQENEGTSAEDFARVPNQPSWDQLVSVDRLAMSIDGETGNRGGKGSVPEGSGPLPQCICQWVSSFRFGDRRENTFQMGITVGMLASGQQS